MAADSPEPRHKRRRSRFPRIPHGLRNTLLAILAAILMALGAAILWAALMPIPAINNFEDRQVAQSTKIYDRTGNVVLYDVAGQVRRTSVPLDEISPYIQQATVAVEDKTFYSNIGVSPLSLLRSAWIDLFAHAYAQGGSTITQQVVKNALLTQDKSIIRKIEEIVLALRLTRVYSKDQILNTYLNETSYGGTVYGVEEASQYFFGVSAKDVDLAQAAYIAAVEAAPTYYSPYGDNKAALDDRKNYVLSQMLAVGDITQDEYNAAVAEQVQFRPEADAGIKAPHFVFYILEYLEQKYGPDMVGSGGLHVITTLDYDLQQKMEDTITKWAPSMQTNFNDSNEGMVAVDPKTGQILAMVGSRDYFNDAIDGQVNVTTSNRQPGSSFKPFVYATAFEKGYTPDTVVFDLPTQFSTSCSPSDNTNDTPPCYSPVNYDGEFRGPINLRDAIAQSRNVPSVKVLYLAGIDDSLKTAQDLGITTLGDSSRYGLSLVLGGGEVNLLEMTGAYAVFANDGVKNPPTGILEVTDQNGNVLEQYQPNPTRVLDPQIARQINDILSDDTARAPDFGVHGPLWFSGADVADKTGTTNDSRDAWIIGYTPSISVGAWAGNNDNSPMVKQIAAFIVTPMWHEFMAYAISKYPADSFPPPAPDPSYDSLPPVLKGDWNTNPSQGIHDILYWVDKSNPRGPPPSNPYNDPQTAAWDYPIAAWASGQGVSPTSTSSPSTPVAPATLAIISPAPGSTMSRASSITASVAAGSNVTSVSYYLNGTFIGTTSAAPFDLSFQASAAGPSTLKAIFQLEDGTTQERDTAFTVQ